MVLKTKLVRIAGNREKENEIFQRKTEGFTVEIEK